MLAHLLACACEDCGETDPVVLEFDHRADKVLDIAALAHAGGPLAALLLEIGKCDVVCANCHRRRSKVRWFQARTDGARRRRRLRNVAHVRERLAEAGCADCGELDPDVLEFDHVGVKRASVATLVWDECSIETIDREIERCEVRCVNCHRRQTAMRGRHYRYVALGTPL